MQNNFSKCREWVPRGTSQHKWRWLTTLLLILTLGIGQMWADDVVISLQGTTSAASKKAAQIGSQDAYFGRCGDVASLSTNGLSIGNSGIFVAFKVAAKSEIVLTCYCTASSNYNKVEYLSTVTWSNITSMATTAVNSTPAKAYFETNFEEINITYDKNTQKNQEYTISLGEYEAGDYAIYMKNSINSGWYLRTITLTPTGTNPPATNYTITYDANGGSGDAMANSTNTVSACTFTAPTGKEFKEWNTKADGKGDSYAAGDAATSDLDLYAIWKDHELSSDATLSALTVGGVAVEGFAAATEEYNVVLPFGTTSVPIVAGTAASAFAKSVVVTQASSVTGDATVVVTAEDNTTTKTYTVHFSVVDSKNILLVFKTGSTACPSGSTSTQILSNNAAVNTYINQIDFTNVPGSGDNGAEGSSLNVGKKTGNMFTLTAKAGYAFKAMNFNAKIQDATCEFSLDGGEWQTLTSTNTGGDVCYNDIFGEVEEVHEFRLRSTGTSGVWIRNMQLTMIQACTPKTIAWSTAPAAEYEIGKSATAIAATANNGTVTYATTDGDVIAVNASTGALTVKALGTVTLSASVPAGNGVTYCDQPAQVSKANVKTYYLVTFDGQNGDAAATVKYYGGAAIALPSAPDYPGYNFQGWFDAATGGNKITEAITPTASRTVYAQWIAQCDGATITTQPTGANYITDRTPVDLVCEATAGNGGALTYEWFTCNDELKTNPVAASATPSTAAVGTYYYFCKVTEAGCDVEAFSNVVTITVADKDPVCIIKATPTSENEATADGAYKGSAFFKGSNAKKLSSGYDYVGVQLMAGKSFLATDKVVLNQAADLGSASDITKFYVFTETPASGKSYATVNNATPKKGDNWFAMPAELVGESSLYIGRVDSKCNPTLGYLAVYRTMNPELMAIKIDGRDGEIDALNDKHFNVTIPYEAVLTSLTVVPTVVRNAAHATTPEAVISNEGAWVLGDNTYRVMDKDGDYTDYTITLTRDQLKHTVRFMDGTSEFASTLVVDGESPVAPATDPEKEDYIFQGWAETVDGDVITDWSAISISAAKDFYAKWVSDGAIKLLNGSTVNHDNFITGVTASTVNIGTPQYDCVTFVGAVGSNVANSNIKNLNRHITYNATTTETKVKLHLYNSSGSKRTIYVQGVIEGNTNTDDIVNLATIELNGNEEKTTEYIEFNSTKNRSIYVFVSGSAGDIKILQEKVIESGTDLKKAGQSGYALNMNKGRIFGASGATVAFEGLSYTLAGDYTTLASEVLKLKSSSIVFTVTNPTLLKVTAANDKTYYVTKGSAGTDNPTAKTGVSEFDLTAGTWYITAGSSEVQLTNIAFELPKAEKPVIATQPASNHTFDPGDMTATVVVNAVSEGTLSYQWYNAANDEEVPGATEATLTTTTEGTYYVVVTNSLAGHQDVSVTSEEAELGYRVTNDATLTALSASTGTLTPAFDKNEENYSVNLAMGTTVVPTLTATATMNGYANVAKNEATEFVNYEAVSTVVVTSEDGTATKTYTVHFYVDHLLDQVPVSATTIWDWTNAGENMKVTTSTSPVKKNEEAVMANIRVDDKQPTNDATFNSQALLFYGENVRAKDGGRYYASVGHIAFNATVPGIVEVEFSSNGDNTPRGVMINELKSDTSKMKASVKTYKAYVPAGDVVLMGYEGDETDKYIRISKITFTANPAVGYTRNVTNNIGTLCVDHNVLPGGALGATFYQIASRNEEYDYKIDFEEVLPNEELKAGEPYIFQSATGRIDLFFGETEAPAPVAVRGMIGNYDASTLAIDEDNQHSILYIAQNKLWSCENLVGQNLILNEHRAYIDMTQVPTYAEYTANPSPGNAPRRRVTLGKDAEQTATGLENLVGGEQAQKLMINGQMFILRGEKLYDATGRLVK